MEPLNLWRFLDRVLGNSNTLYTFHTCNMVVKKLSVIMPVYNEEETILEAVRRVLKARLPKIKKQVIIINDGSNDGTLKKIKQIKEIRVTLLL